MQNYWCYLSLQSASRAIDFVQGFLLGTLASNSSNRSSLSSLGVGNSSMSNFTIILDVDNLANNTIISAGFDASFRLGVSFKVTEFLFVQYLFSTPSSLLADFSFSTHKNPSTKNFGSMVGVGVKSWGASASIVVDPISLSFRYGGNFVGVSDSSLALGIYMRSTGEYFTTVSGISTTSTDPLKPVVVVPFSADVMFNINVSNISISPILTVSSDNVIEGISVDFDLDLGTFIESFDLDITFANITSLLTNIARYGPNLTVGNGPSALTGLFGVVNDTRAFSEALQEFVNISNQGKIACPAHLLPSR